MCSAPCSPLLPPRARLARPAAPACVFMTIAALVQPVLLHLHPSFRFCTGFAKRPCDDTVPVTRDDTLGFVFHCSGHQCRRGAVVVGLSLSHWLSCLFPCVRTTPAWRMAPRCPLDRSVLPATVRVCRPSPLRLTRIGGLASSSNTCPPASLLSPCASPLLLHVPTTAHMHVLHMHVHRSPGFTSRRARPRLQRPGASQPAPSACAPALAAESAGAQSSPAVHTLSTWEVLQPALPRPPRRPVHATRPPQRT